MKEVLRSIKPYWLYLIIIGKKTIEVGKSFPKADDWSRDVVLYCSKDLRSFNRIPEKDREWMQRYLGRCACRFACNYMTGLKADNMIQAYYNNTKGTCLTDAEIKQYANGKKVYYWHISDLVIYDKPRALREFKRFVDRSKGQRYHEDMLYLQRPPQSWCYVESEVEGK